MRGTPWWATRGWRPAPSRRSAPRPKRSRPAPAPRAGGAWSRSCGEASSRSCARGRRPTGGGQPPASLGTHPPERARRAIWVARRARPAPVTDQQHVQLVRLLRAVHEAQHLVVRPLEAGALGPEAEAGADAIHVRVHRHIRPSVGEQQHAGGCLAPHPGQLAEVVAGLGKGCLLLHARSSPSIASRICLIRTALVGASPPGRIASSTSSTGAAPTWAQDEKRSRSRAYATSRLRSFVF